MRLVRVDFRGYKRLRSTTINLDAPVVAVVGPNQAGKTSLLSALAHLSVDGPFVRGELTRKTSPAPNAVILRGWFALDRPDMSLVAGIPGAAAARWFVIERLGDGRRLQYLYPRLERDRTDRERLRTALERLIRLKWSRETNYDDEADAESVASVSTELLPAIALDADTLPDATIEALSRFQAGLRTLKGPATARRAAEAIDRCVSAEKRPHPRDAARDALVGHVPRLLKFELADRSLESEYDLAALDLNSPPAALRNLAHLAEFDLPGAIASVQTGEYGDKLGMIEGANRQLEKVFAASWVQSATVVHLDMDETLLRIFVSNPGGGYSAMAEQSDGLRAFVALIAFTATIDRATRPILLIDEAETHLHYDAQADLVRVFTRQVAASKIVYTTHSAGCLPDDLGTGVRILVPVADSDDSLVQNSFWTEGGGFANLLIGMGASALAFASTRYALVAEGGADTVLLPTLVLEATSRTEVGFQVAPGLAEATSTAIEELDLAAARVAYVVDDDAGGRRLAKKLRDAGIPGDRIIVLGRGKRRGLVLEDTLDPKVFRDAVNAELSRSGIQEALPLSAVRARGRPAGLEQWAKTKGVKAPNRVAVANRALELRSERSLLSESGKRVVRQLFVDAQTVLGFT
jgi:hypothetical protein